MTYLSLTRHVTHPPLRDPLVSGKPLCRHGEESSATVQAPPNNSSSARDKWVEGNWCLVRGQIWQNSVSISRWTGDYPPEWRSASSLYLIHYHSNASLDFFPPQQESLHCLLWPHVLSHSHRYAARGTSCVHLKKKHSPERVGLKSQVQIQQSPPRAHPINHYWGDIMVKQAKSLPSLLQHTEKKEAISLVQASIFPNLPLLIHRLPICGWKIEAWKRLIWPMLRSQINYHLRQQPKQQGGSLFGCKQNQWPHRERRRRTEYMCMFTHASPWIMFWRGHSLVHLSPEA